MGSEATKGKGPVAGGDVVVFEERGGRVRPVVAETATTAADGRTYQVEYFNLDAVLSVGYRVNSKLGAEGPWSRPKAETPARVVDALERPVSVENHFDWSSRW